MTRYPSGKASHMFAPNDRSSRAMFYRSHDRYMGRLHAFADIMAGPNPLTATDLERLRARFPGRYDSLAIPGEAKPGDKES